MPVATKVSVLERVCIYFLCEILIRPHQHVSFLFENGEFFCPFGLSPTLLTDGNRLRIHASSQKTLSRAEIFENAVVLYSCGWMKTEVLKTITSPC